MKVKKYTIAVPSENFRKLTDPQNEGHDTYYAHVCVKHLPLDLPLDVNPRNQDTESRVSMQIQEGLLDEWNVFHLLNRGITISALDVEYDNKNQILTLTFPESSDDYGILDGGHTYAVIKKNILPFVQVPQKPDLFEAFIKLEILVNIGSDLIVDLARARNTSAQVKDESLANLENKFDWIKNVVKNTAFADRIAYRENEENKPIDIRKIIALMTLLHPDFAKSDDPPIIGYSGIGKCLSMFRQDDEGYRKLESILIDILKFYDHIHLRFEKFYHELGGISSIGKENVGPLGEKKKGKLGKVQEVKQIKAGFPLYFSGETAEYRFPDGWLFPVLSAHRAIISYRGSGARWKVDPFKFFDKYGKSLVAVTLEASKALGRNPNAVGKHKNHWVQLYDKTLNSFTELLDVDLDQQVKL